MSYLDEEYEYHEFYLDSSDATNSISTQIEKLNWPQFNLAVPMKDVVSFKILEAQIPISYCVPAGASFKILMYPPYNPSGALSTPVEWDITLPSTGAPSGATIASFIAAQFGVGGNTYPLGWTHSGADPVMTCTFVPSASSPTGLPFFQFGADKASNNYTPNTNSVQDFAIVTDSQRSEDVIGFTVGTTRCLSFGVAASVQAVKNVSSPKVALITGSPYLYISSNAIGNLCKTYLPLGASLLGAGVSSPQIAKIPVSNVVQGQWLVWQDSNQNWFDVDTISTLSQLDLYVQLGNYGGFVDFQGLPFSVKLGVLVRRQTSSTSRFGGSSQRVIQR